GTTLGNALRRILLRSLPGVAVSRVRIADVWHEFSALPNVKEDVTEIVLNLKRINLREVSELRGETHARLQVRGEREVTAGDVNWPGEIECVNPEMHLATLDNGDARLELGLPPRVLNALKSRGIERVGQVLVMDPADLLSIRNFGPQSKKDLWDKLAEFGYLPSGEEGESAAESDGSGDTLDVLEDMVPA